MFLYFLFFSFLSIEEGAQVGQQGLVWGKRSPNLLLENL